MSVFSEEHVREGIIFHRLGLPLPTYTVRQYDPYHKSGDSPIEFRISGQNSMDYLDLKGQQIYVKLRVKKADGTKLGPSEKVGPANLFLQALFASSEVTLQNKTTISCNYNPYRAIIQTLMKYGQDEKSSQLSSQLFKR